MKQMQHLLYIMPVFHPHVT